MPESGAHPPRNSQEGVILITWVLWDVAFAEKHIRVHAYYHGTIFEVILFLVEIEKSGSPPVA